MNPENEKLKESLSRVHEEDVEPFKEECFNLRSEIEKQKHTIKAMQKDLVPIEAHGKPEADMGEMQANLQLAFRALEDARMRIGKAIQAYDGGTSCYPR